MDFGKWFKYIWRINGLLILGSFIFVLIISGIAMIDAILEDSSENTIVNLAKDENGVEKWELGSATEIHGYDLYFLPLESKSKEVDIDSFAPQFFSRENSFSGPSYGGYMRAKNLIFVDATTNRSHWLFPDVNQLLYGTRLIVEERRVSSEPDDRNTNTLAISFVLINADSNGDEKLDKHDKASFALSRYDGSNLTVVVSAYDELVTSTLNGNGDYFLVYVKDNNVYSTVVNLSDFSIVSEEKLPNVPEGQR